LLDLSLIVGERLIRIPPFRSYVIKVGMRPGNEFAFSPGGCLTAPECRADLRYERFKALPIYRKVRTDLKGAEVIILYVQRILRQPINTGAHITFWKDWVSNNNGRLNTDLTMKLQGAAKS
jgi:hypothetical protein